MNYKPKNILVTGAAGFIGSNYVRIMLSRYSDIKIISYDKLTYAGSLDNLKDLNNEHNHIFIKGDICDEVLVYQTLKEYKIDTIVHFAAESHVDNSIANPKVFLETNVIGTFTLLDCAKRYWLDELGLEETSCRFHHISTDEVYGTLAKDEPAFTEIKAYEPNSPYSASKAGSDHIARAYHHTYKLPVTISNCSNNYGPYQHREKLIPVVINSCINYKPIPVYGDGSNIRDWLYVEDHCDAIQTIVEKGVVGEVYNIGGINEVDNLTLVKTICKLMDEYKPENAPHSNLITFVEDRKGHDWRYAIDNSKIQNELGWKPSQDFDKMFRQTIEFYL
ncbi:dTDP-glucose 4,6-dehydratase [Francisella tularensis]|uniref:dTDP-glucose 4,6-dehydratase n=1 Tax=Francisella tularensis TaxID=263 RepID=UPI001C0EDEAC|nr:dTDP-glucose 4,6-dehydratase [Francisella tularensis]MBK2243564.1 dTDP-glucose 4,6-dehydratase [Francisella tularensis]